MENPAYDGHLEYSRETSATSRLSSVASGDSGGRRNEGYDEDETPNLVFLVADAAREYPGILSSKDIFKPGRPVDVKVTNVEKGAGRFFHSYLFEIRLEHAGFHWTIHRTHQAFKNLHRRLKLHAFSLRLSRKTKAEHFSSELKPRLPHLPSGGDYNIFLTPERLEQRRAGLEEYLLTLLRVPLWRDHEDTLRFLEVSRLSFVGEPGEKGKELLVKKLTGRIRLPVPCMPGNWFCDSFSRWKERWVVLKDTYMLYTKDNGTVLRDVFFFDKFSQVESEPRISIRKKSVAIRNAVRELVFKFANQKDLEDWVKSLERSLTSSALPFIKANPNGSSFPVRENIPCKWYIDGAPYMSAIADAMELAKEEIFITDWWLTPEIYMKRPIKDGEKWRLDRILERRAAAGVKVYVLIYKEIAMALGINSWYTKITLESRHPNITVLRSPDHIGSGVWLWSHHEKTVIIDQKIAFIGGIDLCYGRWDDHLYRLTDTGPIDARELQNGDRPREVNAVRPKSSYLRTTSDPGAWSDAAYGILPDHDTWSLRKSQSSRDRALLAKRFLKTVSKRTRSGERVLKRRTKHQKAAAAAEASPAEADLEKLNIKESGRLWLGTDYSNEIRKAFVAAAIQTPFKDHIDRNTMTRMPWHDAGCVVFDQSARDVARHFVQRWNAAKFQRKRNDDKYAFLLPNTRDIEDAPLDHFLNAHKCTVQVVRSVSSWSIGLRNGLVEDSIQKAYCTVIEESKRSIHIENQFFMTLTGDPDDPVLNCIGNSLFRRIERAFLCKEKFRLYLVMPLEPAIEGKYGKNEGAALQAVAHWNYQSICRGGKSLHNRIREIGGDPDEYISVCGMRTFGELNGKLVTELIYVHCKLMIVDDVTTIIGSANINDRSMMGDRDSEVAVVIRDEQVTPRVIDGRVCHVGAFSASLRKRLMRIHLGLLGSSDLEETSSELDDIVSDKFFHEWNRIAAENETIYEEVFGSLPSDHVKDFTELAAWRDAPKLKDTDPEAARARLKQVKGYLCKLSLHFLEKEDMTPSVTRPEGLLPSHFWT